MVAGLNSLEFDTEFKKISDMNLFTRLYKLVESGNRTKISDEKWRSVKSKYLENEKWQKGIVKSTRIMNA